VPSQPTFSFSPRWGNQTLFGLLFAVLGQTARGSIATPDFTWPQLLADANRRDFLDEHRRAPLFSRPLSSSRARRRARAESVWPFPRV
jgi:hypothetical protein